MNPLAYFFIVFGVVLTATGIWLFAKMGTQGTSTVKMFGLEFQLGGSALVIFVVGVVLCLVPLLFGDRFFIVPAPAASSTTAEAVGPSNDTKSLPPTASSPQDGSAIYILTTEGEVAFDEGGFASGEACAARVRAIASQKAVRCAALPDRLFCSLSPGKSGSSSACFPKYEDCTTRLTFDDLVVQSNHLAPITQRCVSTSSSEAVQRSRKS